MVASTKNNKEKRANKSKGSLVITNSGNSKKNANKGKQSVNAVDKSAKPNSKKSNKKNNKKNNQAMKPISKKIKIDESQYPALVPTCTGKYNWNKQILAEFYVKELSHTVYHLWLDCLYERDISIDSIYEGIRPVLGKYTEELPARHIFLNVLKTADYPAGRPAGSCFIFLPNYILKDIDDKIINQRIHMARVHLSPVRDNLKDNHFVVFAKGYTDLLSKLSPKTFRAIYPNEQNAKQIQQIKADEQAETNQQKPEHICKQQEPEDQHEQLEEDTKILEQAAAKKKLERQLKREEQKQQEKLIKQKRREQLLEGLNRVKESRGRDDRSSSPEIIDVITSCEKKNMAQVPTKIQMEESVFKLEFVPVTEESLDTTLKLMKMFETEKRAVAIVFDPCFLLDNIDMKIIRDKYQPIFGNIEPNQVLIRINAPKLGQNLEEAYKGGIKTLNHAYIVGDLGMTDNDINRKAAARGTFCCPMTLGCVINNLKRGIYLMHRSVLFHPCEYRPRPIPESSPVSPNKSISKEVEKNNQSPNNDQQKTNSASKRNRFAASLNGEDHKKDESCISLPSTENSIISKDPDLWNKLSRCGDSVIKIENLPAKLTLDALSLMMGTFTLKSDQIIAANQTDTGRPDLMDIRIVIDGNRPDTQSILTKNNCKTTYKTKLVIERTHHGELRKFMRRHANNLRKLQTSDILPVNRIGYALANNLLAE